MPNNSILGIHIAYHRKINGLTQDELAQKMGVSSQAVSKWEQQLSCPDIMLLPALAEVFHISIDELFGLKVEKEPVYDLVADLPWPDDDNVRIALYHGRKLVHQSAHLYSKGENALQFHFHGGSYTINGKCKFTCT